VEVEFVDLLIALLPLAAPGGPLPHLQ